MRAGRPLTQLVEFITGFPDGDIDWELLDGTGAVITTGSVTPDGDALSAVITIAGDLNQISGDDRFEFRELTYTYEVAGVLTGDTRSYRIEAQLPFGVSSEGVRRKLGAESHEIKDEAIDLIMAVGRFEEYVTPEVLAAATGHNALLARDAIEAMAALQLVAVMPVMLAQRESSGTNQFARGDIDWDVLRAQLEDTIAEGVGALAPDLDETVDYQPLIIAVVRGDPLTGGAV